VDGSALGANSESYIGQQAANPSLIVSIRLERTPALAAKVRNLELCCRPAQHVKDQTPHITVEDKTDATDLLSLLPTLHTLTLRDVDTRTPWAYLYLADLAIALRTPRHDDNDKNKNNENNQPQPQHPHNLHSIISISIHVA
jgi:hypothetical protein